MHWIVRIAEMHISRQPEDIITGFGLGSCLGIMMYDPGIRLGGLLHCLLPLAEKCQGVAENINFKKFTFVDQGLPVMLRQMLADGAEHGRLRVYVAGGASFTNDANDLFSIGIRNFVTVCGILRELKLPLTAKEVGGKISRTLNLHVGTGRVWIQSGGREHEL